jgi:hypothetical protein
VLFKDVPIGAWKTSGAWEIGTIRLHNVDRLATQADKTQTTSGRLGSDRHEASIVEDFRLSPAFPELIIFSSKSFPTLHKPLEKRHEYSSCADNFAPSPVFRGAEAADEKPDSGSRPLGILRSRSS